MILPGGREWSEEMLQTCFNEEDKRLIREIRLGGTNCEDTYCWDYTKTGQYTVKSGYWVKTNVVDTQEAARMVDHPSLDALYQMAWKTEASPKIHHFLWRCINNCLFVAVNLKSRHVLKDAACSRCLAGEESVNHLLFQCSFARLVWAISGILAPPNGTMSDSIYTNLHRVFTISKQFPQKAESETLVPWLLWRIWKNRNELVIKGKEYDALEIVRKAKEDREAWLNRQEVQTKTGTKNSGQPRRNKWANPPSGWVKCNVDGSWAQESNHCGIGWVLRDNRGKVLWMGARKLPKLRSILEVELEAMGWAVLNAVNFGYDSIIFETDSQVALDVLSNKEEWPGFTAIAHDINHLLSQFQHCKVVFRPRDSNCVADRITRETSSFMNYVPKLYSLMPIWIIPFVEVDKQAL